MSDYLAHLLLWTLPVLLGQWLVFAPLLAANARAIAATTAVLTVWLSLADEVAIRAGVWSFGRTHLQGLFVDAVPLEEITFFAVTTLLVTQSLVLFLPRSLKRVPAGGHGWKQDGLPWLRSGSDGND